MQFWGTTKGRSRAKLEGMAQNGSGREAKGRDGLTVMAGVLTEHGFTFGVWVKLSQLPGVPTCISTSVARKVKIS